VASTEVEDARGLDTSIVVRLLTGLPPAQTWRATALVVQEARAAGRPVMVSDLVVAEAYFALHDHYGVPKEDAARSLLALLLSGSVSPEPGSRAVYALQSSLGGTKKPGFVDRLIHAQYERLGRRLVSFERAARKLKNAIVLKA